MTNKEYGIVSKIKFSILNNLYKSVMKVTLFF